MQRAWIILMAAACWGQTKPNTSAPEKATAPQGVTLPPTGSAVPAANDAKAAMVASQLAMAAAIEKQRASVVKQVGSVTGKTPSPAAAFFTVPWVDAPPRVGVLSGAVFNGPPCDPLPMDQLDPLIDENAKRESIRPDLLRAVIGEESGSRPCAVSRAGAQGLMQLMPATIEQFGVRDPFDPKQNVEAGAKLLKQLITKYAGDLRLALSAYNAGPDRVDKDGGVPQIPETINYVTDILSKLPNQ
jgi:Transglycosylase SLT domain